MKGGVELLEIRPEQLSSADLGDQQVLYDKTLVPFGAAPDVSTTKMLHSRNRLFRPLTGDEQDRRLSKC